MAIRSNSIDYLSEVREFHQTRVEPYIGKPIGCSDAEVADLETSIGFELPLAYKQFLLWMGADYYGIFQGTDWLIEDALSNTEGLPQLIEEDSVEFALPSHFLAFFGHQGYMYAWFQLPKTDDNPDVWFYSEGMIAEPEMFDIKTKGIPQHEGKFTDFLLKDMRGLANNLPKSAPLHLASREAAKTGKPVKAGNITFMTATQNSANRNDESKNQSNNNQNYLQKLFSWLKKISAK